MHSVDSSNSNLVIQKDCKYYADFHYNPSSYSNLLEICQSCGAADNQI